VLMVFIHPTILDTQSRGRKVTEDKYNYLRQHQMNFRDTYPSDVLPTLPETMEDINKNAVKPVVGE